jgi:tellurite resistance protein TerA
LIQLVAGQNTVIDSDNTYQLALHIGQWEWGVILSKKGASPVLFDSEQGVSVQDTQLLLNLHDIEEDIQKITVYIGRPRASTDAGDQLSAQLNDLLGQQCYAKIDISGQIANQTALTVLEIYKHQERWKIRCVLQGYSAGLVKLLDAYGIKAPVSKPAAAHREVSQQVKVNKQSPLMASTNNHSSNEHAVGVQLRWQFAGVEKKSIANYFLGEKFKPISDLRIGCFYQLKNGQNGIVYSFDSEFKGSFEGVPYVAANRSTQEHLENLDINDRYLHKLHKCLVFVSMMEAYDSWDGLDVEVKFQIPGVERTIISPSTLMVKPIYAVAMLDFSEELPKITPLNEYFNDLVELDSAFGWGLPFRRHDDDCETNSENDED